MQHGVSKKRKVTARFPNFVHTSNLVLTRKRKICTPSQYLGDLLLVHIGCLPLASPAENQGIPIPSLFPTSKLSHFSAGLWVSGKCKWLWLTPLLYSHFWINLLWLFSHWVMSNSLWSQELQHASLPLSFSISWSWLKFMSIKSVMASNQLILRCPFLLLFQSFPSSGSFSMSWFFASDDQSIGASASPPVLPMNIQGWFFAIQGTLKSLL